MMYKQRRFFGIMLSCILLWGILLPCPVWAAQGETVPENDILIVYSDGASAAEQAGLVLLAENLTYQDYQVTFAPASLCMGELADYERLLIYKVERYPEELVEELFEQEQKGADILVMGNLFLQDYLQRTGRKGTYQFWDVEVGNLQYAFSGVSVKETLALEDGFLFLTDSKTETYGSVRLADAEGYFCANTGTLTHLTLTDLQNPLVRAASFREISRWLWEEEYAQYKYAQYLVIDQVYPFEDPDRLLLVVNKFLEQEQPFIITVMPIYEHTDYPAMERFCEILRYAQAKGGTIMLHSPLNQMAYFDADKVNEALDLAMSNYMGKGVYPLGLQVPESWLFRQDTLGVLDRFQTLVVTADADRLAYADLDLDTNTPYFGKHQWIAPAIALDGEGTSYLTCYSSAIYFDIMETEERIDRRLAACMESEAPLKDIRDADHTVYTEAGEVNFRNGGLYVNGELTEVTFTPAPELEDFSYNRNMLQRVSRDLTSQNRKLLFGVAAVSLLFIVFIIIARYRNRKRFFIKLSVEEPGEAAVSQETESFLAENLPKEEFSVSAEGEGEKAEAYAPGEPEGSVEEDYDLAEPADKWQDDYDIRELDEQDDYDLII